MTGNGRLAEAYSFSRAKHSPIMMEMVLIKRLMNVFKMKERWDTLGIEAVLIPCSPVPAFKIENAEHFSVCSGALFEYASLFGSLYFA